MKPNGDLDVEGEDNNDCLEGANILSVEEVVNRRLKKVRKLMKVYKSQYWALLEEMRSKHRKFYIKHGRGGWVEKDFDQQKQQQQQQEEAYAAVVSQKASTVGISSKNEPHAPDKPASATLHCAVTAAAPNGPCYNKPVPLTGFCIDHILMAPRQKLYKPCTFLLSSGSSSNGEPCGRPVLGALKPLLCAEHQIAAERQVRRAMKLQASSNQKGQEGLGFDVSEKSSLKLHLVIGEYVRQIQHKRRRLAVVESASKLKSINGGHNVVISLDDDYPEKDG